MSEIAELTGAGRSDLLPGYILSPFTWGMFGQCEKEWEQQLLAKAAQSAIGLPQSVADAAYGAALKIIATGVYAHGEDGFDVKANMRSSVPFLVWLSASFKHPDLTRDAVAAMMPSWTGPTRQEFLKLRRGVLELMGYSFNRLAPKAAGRAPGQPESGPSSKPSANEASDPTPSVT